MVALLGRAMAVATITFAVAASGASAHEPLLAPYDGTNPFSCELQQAGFGISVPDPEADPFCVEFDKRRQNLAPELGLVQFLLLEPARVAAASPKCFYYQHDHWRGSVVQDDERTETWNWDGRYYFDKARGAGGAYVENFTINNQTADPRQLPGFPDEWKPFFGPGRGGVKLQGAVRADPRCVEPTSVREESPDRCRDVGGPIGRGIGGIELGMTRAEVEQRLGAAARERRGFLRYCLMDGGKLAAGLGRGVVRFVLTTSPAFAARGVRVGSSSRAARGRLRGARTLARRRGSSVLAVRGRGRTLLAGLRGNRVVYLAVAAPDMSDRAIGGYLTRSR